MIQTETIQSNTVALNNTSTVTMTFNDTIGAGDMYQKILAYPRLLSIPEISGASAQWVDFSSDGTYLAVGTISSGGRIPISVYRRSGDTFTKLPSPSTAYSTVSTSGCFAPNASYLAVGHSNSPPYFRIYKRSQDVFSPLSNPTITTGSVQSCKFTLNDGGAYLAVGIGSLPTLHWYGRSGDTFTKLPDPSVMPPGLTWEVDWSADGVYLAVAHQDTPFLSIYKRSGNTLTKLANPNVLPANIGRASRFSHDGAYLAVGGNAPPSLFIYKRVGDTFVKLADPEVMPLGNMRGFAWSPDNTLLHVAGNTRPVLATYKRSGDTFAKISDPPTLTGSGYGCDYSNDGTYLAVALTSNTNSLVVFKNIQDSVVRLSSAGDLNDPSSIGYSLASGNPGDSRQVVEIFKT